MNTNFSFPLQILLLFRAYDKFILQNIGQKDYYERQFATLKSFEDVDSVVLSEEIDEEDIQEQAQHERAMMISNYANILLLAFKVRKGILNVAFDPTFFPFEKILSLLITLRRLDKSDCWFLV